MHAARRRQAATRLDKLDAAAERGPLAADAVAELTAPNDKTTLSGPKQEPRLAELLTYNLRAMHAYLLKEDFGGAASWSATIGFAVAPPRRGPTGEFRPRWVWMNSFASN